VDGRHHRQFGTAGVGSRRRARVSAATASVVLLAGLALGCAGSAPRTRVFPDRPVAWQEHDDGHVARPPAETALVDLGATLILRDSLAGEIDYYMTLEGPRPARDVNAFDEVPCSTWFCARNHLQAMSPAEVAAGPADTPPRPPFRIRGGKANGVALGFEVIDAGGRKFLLKPDVAGHAGMASAAEVVGGRIFHAAGYNVPGSVALDLDPETDLELDPRATFILYDVQRRPFTAAHLRQQLEASARGPDGRIRAVIVSWLPGRVLGPFDMIGGRADDPNDRIPHEQRRSLRASRLLFAWLAVLDAGSPNTLDTYVEEGGRHFVRHYFIDFGAGLGSATTRQKGLQHAQEHYVEVGRSLAALAALGLYQRPYERQRQSWSRLTAEHPELGWFPAEEFDPDEYRSGRKIPAHRRMTDRDAYWGAKLVTSFSDEQIAAIVGQARLPASEQEYLTRTLRIRRDIIGRRYLRAVTAVEAPRVAGGGQAVCFDDLAVARGYAAAGEVRYAVAIEDRAGRRLGAFSVPATAPVTCVPVLAAGGSYRVVEVKTLFLRDGKTIGRAKAARVHLSGPRVLGLERDE
jgi:hypothetical protein